MKISVSLLSGLVFGVIAVLHLLRLIYGWEAQIGTFAVPMWLSWVALVLGGLLSAANFSHCHKCKM